MKNLIPGLENIIFGHRRLFITIFLMLTIFMGYSATKLRIDAGFSKLLPLNHEYMQTFVKHGKEFGGANQILIALKSKNGSIFKPDFFDTLKKATDDVFYLSGVDRTKVKSLFTPNVRFTEVTEVGFAGGKVVPADFQTTPEGLEQVRKNILKSNIIGQLVAVDFSAAIISAELLDINPDTGERLDYLEVAKQLENIRSNLETDEISVHIIGFAKFIGDMTDGAKRVILFFGIAFLITGFLVYWYTQSCILTVTLLTCSLTAVIWQLGLLPLLGFGIDPMSILVPFLVFAIGISHGVQMVSSSRAEVFNGADNITAARASFRRLLIPGCIALASDTIGFITILLIDIQMIQEMAITASLGVAVIIFTNLLLLPLLLSYVTYEAKYRVKTQKRALQMQGLWRTVAKVTEFKPAAVVLLIAVMLVCFGAWKGSEIRIGDIARGIPELRPDSRYNKDSRMITSHFYIGVDIISVIVETVPDACIDYNKMDLIDRFAWHMSNVPGVLTVVSLPRVAKAVNGGWNEGYPKWQVLPRNQLVLVQSIKGLSTSSGLFSPDCSVMPVKIYTADHKAETIARIVAEVKSYNEEYGLDDLQFKLACGNVGVMAATNEVVSGAQFPILIYLFMAIIILCFLTYRSLKSLICIIAPLGLVSLLGYAVMSLLGIGLKVSTLPVVALGVGVGVDYGIYIYSRFIQLMDDGVELNEAYFRTLEDTGNAVVFTGVTLAIGVATWVFSPLKFQADMGILLTFMFLVNMLGAIILLPALARWLTPAKSSSSE